MAAMDYQNLLSQWSQRRDVICRWYRQGRTMRSIAKQLDLSVQRVQQIVSKERKRNGRRAGK